MTEYERGQIAMRERAAKEVHTDDTRELCCNGYDCECRKPEDAAFVAAEIEARRIKKAILSLTPEATASQPEGVVVPREPTKRMVDAACEAADNGAFSGEYLRRIWTAMLAAAKEE